MPELAASPVALLIGVEAGDVAYWTWEWNDGTEPGYSVIPIEVVHDATSRLRRALPEALPEDAGSDPASDDWARRELPGYPPTLVRSLYRTFHGELCDPAGESELALNIGQALLPDALVEQIRGRCTPQNPGVLRMMPSPATYAVPWELMRLSADSDERLIEYVTVVMVSPCLTRDGLRSQDRTGPDVAEPQRDAERGTVQINWSPDAPCVKVIDPDGAPHGQVLNDRQRHEWTGRAAGSVGPRELSDLLRGTVTRPGRFLYVGHVSEGIVVGTSAGRTALELSGPALQARDLFAGSTQLCIEIADGNADPNEVETSRQVFPDQCFEEGTLVPVSGIEIWPMPPRVGIFACLSGGDLGHLEPFGLVTAALEGGAELVTATRWTLPTDATFRLFGCETQPFNTTAHALDDLHQTADPLQSLGAWQRDRLTAWRTTRQLGDAPLVWASLANHHAPDRQESDVSQFAEWFPPFDETVSG